MNNYVGPCVGGPLHGQVLTSRFPGGALVVDRTSELVWIYEWNGDGFIERSTEPMKLVSDETAPVNRWRAAREFNYDVIALPNLDDSGE